MAKFVTVVGLVVACILISSTDGQKARFALPIYETDIGSDVAMKCFIDPGETFDGFYLPNGDKATAGGRYAIDEAAPTFTLTITSIVEEDHGAYECRLVGGASSSVTVKIRVTIGSLETPQNIAVDYTGTIKATVTGFPRSPKISWYKVASGGGVDELLSHILGNGTVLGGSRYNVSVHGSLTIKDVKAADAGDYRLEVTTDSGVSKRVVTINVGAKPTFTKSPNPTYSVTKGENLMIPCELQGITGIPTWTFNNSAGVITTLATVGRITVRPTLLEIDTTERSDEGQYVCSGSNTYGTASATAHLEYVIDPPSVAITEPGDLLAEASANLTCTGTGYPLPTVTWMKLVAGAFARVASQKNTPGSSVIPMMMLKQSDAGLYQCTADNGAMIGGVAKTASENRTLVINSPAKASVDSALLTYVISKQESKTITCTVTGLPAPTIKFMFGGNELPPSVPLPTPASASAAVTATLNYTVTAANQLGNVTCEASNLFGTSSAGVQIVAISKPATPTGLLVNAGTTTIRVSWAKPAASGSAPTKYTVTAKGTGHTKTTDTVGTSVILKDMIPGMEYNVSVVAINDAGSSDPMVMTTETKRHAKPAKPVITSSGGTLMYSTFHLALAPPVNVSGNLTYRVTICQYNVVLDSYAPCEVIRTQSSLDLKVDLKEKTRYRVSVFAVNADGLQSETAKQDFMTGSAKKKTEKESGLSGGAVIGIVITVLIIIFIIVDLCCCFFNNCGFSHCCFESLCSGKRGKYAAAEVNEEVMMDKKGAV